MRFKDNEGKAFPEWSEENLGNVLSFHPTNSLSRNQLNYDGGEVKNIHYGDIHTKFKTLFDVTKENVPFINSDVKVEKFSEENYCKPGDLVIADASEDYNDVGKTIEIINTNNEKIVAGLHTYLARNKVPMALGFKGYLMQSALVRKQIMTIATGISVLGISKTNLAKVKFHLPTLEEQEKIAGFLSAIDKKIENLERELEELRTYKKGVMQAIFANDADATERRIKIEGGKVTKKIRFKDGNDNYFPDWKEKALGVIAKVYDGTHMTPKYTKQGVPFYSVEHVTSNNFQDTKFIAENVYEAENQRVKLEKGDILMTRIGDIGTAKYIDWDVKASFYVSLALIKHSKGFDSRYLSYFIHSYSFQQELYKRTIHVAFPKKINLGEISNCLVKLPSLSEQQKIASFLSAIDAKINAVDEQLTHTRTYKKGLLQQLFV